SPEALRGSQLSEAYLHVIHPTPDGGVTHGVVLRQAMLEQILAQNPREERRITTLAPQSESLGEVIESGELPPVDLGLALTGTIAQAPSREAQCRVLQEWIAPVSAGRDVQNHALDTILREFTPAF